jgi:hypothetical protein
VSSATIPEAARGRLRVQVERSADNDASNALVATFQDPWLETAGLMPAVCPSVIEGSSRPCGVMPKSRASRGIVPLVGSRRDLLTPLSPHAHSSLIRQAGRISIPGNSGKRVFIGFRFHRMQASAGSRLAHERNFLSTCYSRSYRTCGPPVDTGRPIGWKTLVFSLLFDCKSQRPCSARLVEELSVTALCTRKDAGLRQKVAGNLHGKPDDVRRRPGRRHDKGVF